jgi:hypothetical protein
MTDAIPVDNIATIGNHRVSSFSLLPIATVAHADNAVGIMAKRNANFLLKFLRPVKNSLSLAICCST